MVKKISFFVVFIAIAVSAFLYGRMLYQPVFHDAAGSDFKFADYRGKWIVVNYWASWCKPCIKEIPELNAFYQAHRDFDAIVVGVNFDHVPPQQLSMIIQEMGVTFPTLREDPSKMLGIKSLPGIPATYIISPIGKIKTHLFGIQTRESLEREIGLPPQKMLA